jgi:hypothetical protein
MSEEGADVGEALQGGHDAAVARMEGSGGAEPSEPSGDTNEQVVASEQTAPATPQAAPEQTGPAPAYTYTDQQGNQVPLTKEVLDHFVSTMLNVYQQMGDRNAMPRGGARGQQQQQQSDQAPDIPADAKKMLDPYLEYFFKQKMGTYEPKFQQMDEMMVDFQANRMLSEAAQAIDKDMTLKSIISNPKHAQTVKGLVMFMRGQFGMNYDQASKHVGTMLREIIEGNKADYIKQKVTQSKTKMEGAGGAIPAPGNHQPNLKDWHKGTLLEKAMGKLKSAFAEGT